TNVRGYGRFTREVVRAMCAVVAAPDRIAMLVDAPTRKRDDFPGNLELGEVGVAVPPGEAASASGSRSLKDLLAFRRATARDPADVVWLPTVYSYFPVAGRVPVAVSFLDTIAESLPSFVFQGWKNRFFWTLKGRAAASPTTRVVDIR